MKRRKLATCVLTGFIQQVTNFEFLLLNLLQQRIIRCLELVIWLLSQAPLT